MMRSNLERRLSALEDVRGAETATPQPLMGGVHLLMLLIAGHLGGMTEGESVGSAFGRAVGHDPKLGAKAVLLAPDISTRHSEAVARLLALKGTTVQAGGTVVRDALQSLFDELPENVQRHPFAEAVRADLNEAMELLCL
jgi:hypothetical protein